MAELWPGGPIELPHVVTIDGIEVEIPEIPTSTLLGWLATGAWWSLFPESVDQTRIMPLTARFVDDEDNFDFENLWFPATTLFGRLAGTHGGESSTGWWPALRLAATATANWTLYTAWCATVGSSPIEGPLWRVTGTIYGWLRALRAGDEQELAKLDQFVWAPPPVKAAAEPEQLPQHVREEEAKLALAALAETLPGEDRISEWQG